MTDDVEDIKEKLDTGMRAAVRAEARRIVRSRAYGKGQWWMNRAQRRQLRKRQQR